MAFILSLLAAVAWPLSWQTAQVQDDPSVRVSGVTVAECIDNDRLYSTLAEGSVRIQPWLLTKEGGSETMQKVWADFYQHLRPELQYVVLRAKVLRIGPDDLIPGEAFADQVDVGRLIPKIQGGNGSINVVYTDFNFGNVFHAQDGIYLRQEYAYLSPPSPGSSFSASTEQQFLAWLAYINQ